MQNSVLPRWVRDHVSVVRGNPITSLRHPRYIAKRLLLSKGHHRSVVAGTQQNAHAKTAVFSKNIRTCEKSSTTTYIVSTQTHAGKRMRTNEDSSRPTKATVAAATLQANRAEAVVEASGKTTTATTTAQPTK